MLLYNISATTASIREHVHTDGVKYLIAPTVAIVEGVMNDVLYIEEEINAYIAAWNGRPLIIDHPVDSKGEFISANSPELLPGTIGAYYNAVFEDAKLKGEWWVNIEKAQKVKEGPQVLAMLKAGKMLEQSTGLFTDVEVKAGTFNGVPYSGIARNIRPDHLAILLHDEGACSIKDGCGTPRMNVSETEDEDKVEVETVPDNSIVLDITSVVETIKTATKNLSEVVTNLFKKSLEDNQMTREELIQWIIDNSPTIPYTIDMLNVATDEVLQAIVESLAQPEIVVEEEATPEPNEAAVFDAPVPPIAPVAQPTASGELPDPIVDLLAGLEKVGGVPGVLSILEEAKEARVSHFDGIVEMLTANSEYTAEDLKGLPIEFLQKMATNIAPNTPCQQGPVYANRMAGANTVNNSEWEPYTAPAGGK